MSELEKRVQRNKDTMEFETDEIEKFRDEIERSIYPPKCLKCYCSGLRYCIWWEYNNFSCEDVQEGEIEDIATKFVKRNK